MDKEGQRVRSHHIPNKVSYMENLSYFRTRRKINIYCIRNQGRVCKLCQKEDGAII